MLFFQTEFIKNKKLRKCQPEISVNPAWQNFEIFFIKNAAELLWFIVPAGIVTAVASGTKTNIKQLNSKYALFIFNKLQLPNPILSGA